MAGGPSGSSNSGDGSPHSHLPQHQKHASPQAVFTSFKLPKPGASPAVSAPSNPQQEPPLIPVRYSPGASPASPNHKKMTAPLGGLPGLTSSPGKLISLQCVGGPSLP